MFASVTCRCRWVPPYARSIPTLDSKTGLAGAARNLGTSRCSRTSPVPKLTSLINLQCQADSCDGGSIGNSRIDSLVAAVQFHLVDKATDLIAEIFHLPVKQHDLGQFPRLLSAVVSQLCQLGQQPKALDL